jgi:hypothetical protein
MELSGFDCPIGGEAWSVGHDWLKNTLLRDLADEATRSTWLEGDNGDIQEDLQSAGGWLRRAGSLGERIVAGFSPAVLVAVSPLGRLPANIQDLLRDAAHRAYLAASGIEGAAVKVEQAVSAMRSAVERASCARGRQERELALASLDGAAKKLMDAVYALPRGVVLP